VADPVGNVRTITSGQQATTHVIYVISAIAAIVVALRVVAAEITMTIANIMNGT
jgi:hypothetical protein